MSAPPRRLHLGLFTEVYHPIVNGVVASVAGLRRGMLAAGLDVTTFAPAQLPHRDDEADVVRLPSLSLPTATGYRLCVPYLKNRALRERLDIVHAHSPFVSGALALTLARRNGIPIVFSYHTRLEEYAHYAPLGARLGRAGLVALTRAYANACDAVLVPTRAMETQLRAFGVRVPIAVVPSAIDGARFAGAERTAAMRARLGAADDRQRIALIVARLGREKGITLAIDALTHAPELRLAVVGGGSERAPLAQRAAQRGVLERVRFVGPLAPAQMPDAYAAADVFAHPSASETQGLVLLEALSAGLPVVAVDVPVSREVLGAAGRLVRPEAAAFARALTEGAAEGRRPHAAWPLAGYTRDEQVRRTLIAYRDAFARQSAVHLAL